MNLLRTVSRLYTSRKRIAAFGASAFIIGLILGALLLNFGGIPGFDIPSPTPPHFPPSQPTAALSNKYMGRGIFLTTLPEITVEVNASQYELPVNLSEVAGYDELKNWLRITPEQENLLS